MQESNSTTSQDVDGVVQSISVQQQKHKSNGLLQSVTLQRSRGESLYACQDTDNVVQSASVQQKDISNMSSKGSLQNMLDSAELSCSSKVSDAAAMCLDYKVYVNPASELYDKTYVENYSLPNDGNSPACKLTSGGGSRVVESFERNFQCYTNSPGNYSIFNPLLSQESTSNIAVASSTLDLQQNTTDKMMIM